MPFWNAIPVDAPSLVSLFPATIAGDPAANILPPKIMSKAPFISRNDDEAREAVIVDCIICHPRNFSGICFHLIIIDAGCPRNRFPGQSPPRRPVDQDLFVLHR